MLVFYSFVLEQSKRFESSAVDEDFIVIEAKGNNICCCGGVEMNFGGRSSKMSLSII